MNGFLQYDPDSFLPSALDAIQDYVSRMLQDNELLGSNVEVEMSFPDTTAWTKKSPLDKSLVHFELDDMPSMILGFGAIYTFPEPDEEQATTLSEASLHHLNFDVGIWTSPETGGPPKRAQIRQALLEIFGRPGGRIAFTSATGGLQIVSYSGGSDVLDRVNDLPLYRTTGLTIVVSGFARYTDPTPVYVPLDVGQAPELTNEDDDHLVTVEGPWT